MCSSSKNIYVFEKYLGRLKMFKVKLYDIYTKFYEIISTLQLSFMKTWLSMKIFFGN